MFVLLKDLWMSCCLSSIDADCVVKSPAHGGRKPDGGVVLAESPAEQEGGGVLGRTVLDGGDVGDVH